MTRDSKPPQELQLSKELRLSRLVTIPAYHRVLDVPDVDAFPFDIELVSASVGSFAEQMRFVRRHFTPITSADLLRHLDGGEPPPRGAVIVTFDDGFADNYRNAFPVLRELGIPATIFLSTGFVDRQEAFWFERAWADIREYGYRRWLGLLSRKAWHFWRPWPLRVAHGRRGFWVVAASEAALFAAGGWGMLMLWKQLLTEGKYNLTLHKTEFGIGEITI